MKNEKDTTLTAITLGSKYFSNVRSSALSLSHANLEQPFRNLQIKMWGKICYKEVFLRLPCVRRLFLRLYHCASVYYCVVVMLHEHVYVYISIFIMWVYNKNTWTLFYLRSHRGQCLPLLASGYAVGIGQVFFQEALDHMRSLGLT